MMMNISASSGLFGFRVGQSTASLRHRDGNGPQSIERLQPPFRIARWAVDPVSARRRVVPAAEVLAAILRRCSDSPPGGNDLGARTASGCVISTRTDAGARGIREMKEFSYCKRLQN
jgi:hypothetical protein